MSDSSTSLHTDGTEPVSTRPHDFSTRPPEITILSDHASHDRGEDTFEKGSFALQADSDRLELHTRLASIYDILRHRNTRCPLAIAIYGDWGSGKTSAMRWLESRLHEWNKVEKKDRCSAMEGKHPHPRVYPIWFDPWRYQTREEVWRGIIAEVILALFSIEHLNRQNLVPRLIQAAKKFGTFLGKSFLHALASIEIKATGGTVPGDPSLSGEAFRDIWEEYQKVAQPHEAYLNQFEATLRQWVIDFLSGPDQPKKSSTALLTEPARLCIFIDDLDRCLPEVTLQVIEALKLYLNIDHLIFVVGLDDSVVRSIITQHYQKNGVSEKKALSYLDKIFQVEQRITVTGKRMPEYMRQQIEVLDQASNRYWSRMLNPTGHKEALEQSLVHLAGNNPRTCKRLLNSAFLLGQAASLDPSLTPKTETPKIAAFGGDSRKWHHAMEKCLEELRHLRFAQGIQVYAIQASLRQRFNNTRDLMEEPMTVLWLEQVSVIVRQILAFEGGTVLNLQADLHGLARLKREKEAIEAARLERNGKGLIGVGLGGGRIDEPQLSIFEPSLQDQAAELCVFLFDSHLSRPPHEDESFWHSEFFLRLMSVPFSAAIAEHFPPSRTTSSFTEPVLQSNLNSLPPAVRERLAKHADVPTEDLHPDHLRGIQDLDLSDLSLESEHIKKILEYCNIHSLNLSSNNGLRNTAALTGLSHLETLYLCGCTGLDGSEAWQGIAGLTSLRTLNLMNCTGLRDTAALAELHHLETLYLNNCTGLLGVESWHGLLRLESMRKLVLIGCTGLRDTSVLCGLNQLETLYLNDCTGLVNEEAWKGLSNLKELRELYLDQCVGLLDTNNLSNLHSLERLILKGCSGLKGYAALQGLTGLKSLQMLDIRDCGGLDVESVREVRRMIRRECYIIGPDGKYVES